MYTGRLRYTYGRTSRRRLRPSHPDLSLLGGFWPFALGRVDLGNLAFSVPVLDVGGGVVVGRLLLVGGHSRSLGGPLAVSLVELGDGSCGEESV